MRTGVIAFKGTRGEFTNANPFGGGGDLPKEWIEWIAAEMAADRKEQNETEGKD